MTALLQWVNKDWGFPHKKQLMVKASALLHLRAASLLPFLLVLPGMWRDQKTGSCPWQAAAKAKVKVDGWPQVPAWGLMIGWGGSVLPCCTRDCAWGMVAPQPLFLGVHPLSILLAPVFQKGIKKEEGSNPKREWVQKLFVKQMSGSH